MAARDYLIAYGYKLCEDDKYRKPGKATQVWQELPDGKGWLRFDPDTSGNEVPEVYKVSESYQGTSGLHKTLHPEAFEWIYPEKELEKIYKTGVEAKRQQLKEAMEKKGQASEPVAVAEKPGLTEEQLAAMQIAQAQQGEVKPSSNPLRRWLGRS